jgi:hypothetical protein
MTVGREALCESSPEADPSALFERRYGLVGERKRSLQRKSGCPDIWELDKGGDVAVIGRDLSRHHRADYSATYDASSIARTNSGLATRS